MDSGSYSPSREGRPIQCHLCQTTFTRQEHLSRHLRSHNAEKPFHCVQCGKSFSRLDVLHRHGQSHTYKRKASEGRGGSSSRACKECALSRVRCSRGSPCDRCSEKNTQCEYPLSRKRKSQSGLGRTGSLPQTADNVFYPSDVNSFQLHSSQQHLNNSIIDALPPTSNVLGEDSETQPPNAGITQEWLPLQESGTLPSTSPGVASEDMLPFENHALANQFGQWIGNLTSVNWLSPEGFNLFPEAQLENLLLPEGKDGATVRVESMERLSEHAFQSNRDTAVPAEQENTNATDASAPLRTPSGTEQALTADQSTCAETTTDSPTLRHPEGAYYVEGSAGRAPFKGRSSWRARMTSRRSIDRASGEQARPDSESTTRSRGHFVSETIYQSCRQCLAAESNRLGLGIDMTTIPLLGEIQDLVQLYFDWFHPTYPFLQKSSSLFIKKTHWILLLAVAATGSRYSTEARYHKFGDSLVDMVDQVVSMRLNSPALADGDRAWKPGSESEGEGALDIVTIQAALLNSISLLQSGKEHGVRHALRRRFNFFKAYHALKQTISLKRMSSQSREGTEEDAFQNWVDLESLIRTGWMIWFLDCISIYQFRCTPLIHLGDTKAPLPCQEDLWDVPSPPENFSNSDHQTVTLLEALELLHMEKTLPPKLGNFSATIIIFGICRRNQEATVQYQTNLTLWSPSAQKQPRPPFHPIEEGWPPALSSLSRWRNSACDCLDILHWNANSISARLGGWEHPTILHLHLARLLLLAPIQHIEALGSESMASHTPQAPSPTAHTIARYHTLRWAIRDQYKARLCLVHAGALFWHIRRYSSNSFLEPFSVYTATLVIWAYSMAMHTMKGQGHEEANLPESLPHPGDPAQQEGQHLGETGLNDKSSDSDTEVMVIQIDRPCDDEIVQNFVRFGHTMSARMHRVGNIREPSAPRRIIKQGIRLLTGGSSDPDRAVPNWGVEKSFIDSLNSFTGITVVASENDRLPG
ncbi:fungal-specific transcription factor domain-containing protein [Aspergillus spinulosporus]